MLICLFVEASWRLNICSCGKYQSDVFDIQKENIASCHGWDVEKMIHEVQWSSHWISTQHELCDFLFGVSLATMRSLYQHGF